MKMEIDDLEIEVGTKETASLKPKKVKVLSLALTEIKSKDGKYIGKKLNCIVKHPDRDEAINISSLQFVKGKEIKTTGIWMTKDSDNLIQKGSSLAILLDFMKAKTIKELVGKEIDTVLDEAGYVVFKV